MELRTYECVLVLDPGLDAENILNQLERFQEQILHNNGLIRKWDRWGKKRLAYEIRRKQYGYYAVVVFDVEPTAIRALERYIRLNNTILRHLIVVMEPKRIPEIEPSADLRSAPEKSEEEPPSSIIKEKEATELSGTSSDELIEEPREEENDMKEDDAEVSTEEESAFNKDTE